MKRAILIGIIMILLVPQLSWGQIPQMMSYQGVVTDASGVAIDGDVDLTFMLWDAAAEGTQLWTETQPSTPLNNGIFNVILGSVNAFNIPFDKQYWLGVTVGTDPELTPRILLTSSPYSLSTRLDSDLTTIAGFTHTDGNFIVSDGTNWVLENGATARTSLGLGSMALQSSDVVDINGGAIDGSLIGATTPAAGTFTSLVVEGTATATAFVGDGSALTNLPGGGTVSSITAGTGLTGGTITTTGTIAVDVGTTADKIVQLDGSGKLPAVDGSALTNLPVGGTVTAIDDLSDGSTSGGAGNLFLGTSAGAAIQSGGIQNTGLGFEALKAITFGNQNTASGYQSLFSNTEGSWNTASGFEALRSNTTGSFNTASGYQALFSNTEGSWNTASGYQSLFSNTSTDNTASGYKALFSNTTGAQNTASGYGALLNNTTGWYNTANGFLSLFANTTAYYNTAVGTNSLRIANRTTDTNGYNTAVGYNAGGGITTGQYNVIIGANSDPSAAAAVNQIVIGYAVTGTGDNEIALGNASITAIKGQVSFTTYSDRRIKRDIQDGNLGLAFINELRPVKYKLKNPADYPEPLLEERFRSGKDERVEDDETVYDGLIAQEVKLSMDKLGVSWSGWSEDDNTAKQGIQYGALVVPLIKAVQELSAKVEELEGQIKHLEESDAGLTVNNGKDQLVRSN